VIIDFPSSFRYLPFQNKNLMQCQNKFCKYVVRLFQISMNHKKPLLVEKHQKKNEFLKFSFNYNPYFSQSIAK